MAAIVVPATATPSQDVSVQGSGFDWKVKFALTTVDAHNVEVGKTSNTNRPKVDGTFSVGILVPPVLGPSKIRAYQRDVVVAEANVLVQSPTALPPAPKSLVAKPQDRAIALTWIA